MVGGLAAIGYHVQQTAAEAEARQSDRTSTAKAAILARFAEMRKKAAAGFTVQPSTHFAEVSTISLDMIKNEACVHLGHDGRHGHAPA